MREDKKVLIQGEEYDIRFEQLESADGVCDHTSKVLKINSSMLIKTPDQLEEIGKHINKVIRHEVIHALMSESGCRENSCIHDEPTVDWIAYMYPKMKKIFEELGCDE